MTSKKSKSPWCRGVEGQEHDFVLIGQKYPPFCQPLRDWRRRTMETMEDDTRAKLRYYDQQLSEDWECFHCEQCQRCRKKTHRLIFRDECPQARPGAVVTPDPPQPLP
jgi:hypothetical protein